MAADGLQRVLRVECPDISAEVVELEEVPNGVKVILQDAVNIWEQEFIFDHREEGCLFELKQDDARYEDGVLTVVFKKVVKARIRIACIRLPDQDSCGHCELTTFTDTPDLESPRSATSSLGVRTVSSIDDFIPTTMNEVSFVAWIESCSSVLGPQCFLPGTVFPKADGSIVQVDELKAKDVLRGPTGEVAVSDVLEHTGRERDIVDITTRDFVMSVTADHRMFVRCQNGREPKQADRFFSGELLCTSRGDVPVTITNRRVDTPVFEVTLSGERSLHMSNSVAQFAYCSGSCAGVPYDPSEYTEFRFKGPICETLTKTSIQQWLLDLPSSGFQIGSLDLQFWTSRPLAVWVRNDQAQEFFCYVDAYLRVRTLREAGHPGQSRIYRQNNVTNPLQVFRPWPPKSISQEIHQSA